MFEYLTPFGRSVGEGLGVALLEEEVCGGEWA